jgi:tetratricopeptide (TPR) repeat protein
VDGRATWQALQARLTAARDALVRGDRDGALAEITAALDIDPDFLAAHSLREWILALEEPLPASFSDAKVDRSGPEEQENEPEGQPHVNAVSTADGDAMAVAEERPPTFADGCVNFEQRAKRRRITRRLEAARAALTAGNLNSAAEALDELIELDPNLPDLAALTAELDDLRRTRATARPGPRVAAAAAFVLTTMLGASWLEESTSLISWPIVASAPLVVPPIPVGMPSSEAIEAGAASGDPRDDIAAGTAPGHDPRDTVAAGTAPLNNLAPATVPAVRPAAMADVMPQTEREVVAAPPPAVLQESPVSLVPQPVRSVAVHEAAVVAQIAAPTEPPAGGLADEDSLVKQALQRYRRAYEGLDAQSAHAVWPAVNQAALARAFDGLESQALVFDACDVRVRGDSATATCHGSARYVPKIGSREMRVEPRVWSFALHKNAGDWEIDSARAER